MPWLLKKVTSSDLQGLWFCYHNTDNPLEKWVIRFQPRGFIHKLRSCIYMPWFLKMVTSSDLWGCWFCVSYINHVHIPCNPSLSHLGSFLSPKVAFKCRSFYEPWLLATSKTVDFVVMTFVMPNYPLYQVSAQGFVHKPINSIYRPWLLNKVTSIELRGHWFCGHDIYHVQTNFSPKGGFISPETAFIWHGYKIKWSPVTSKDNDFMVLTPATSKYPSC